MPTQSSGTISLGNIHYQLGDGPSTGFTSIGASDMGPRLGYTGFKAFSYFYKSWGTSVTHAAYTVPATTGKFGVPAIYYKGYSKYLPAFGSALKSDLNQAATPTPAYFDELESHTGGYLPSGTTSTYFRLSRDNGTYAVLQDTDPYRANNTNRFCWNNSVRPIGTETGGFNLAPSTNYGYWVTPTTLPTSGTYNVGIRWN